jgi:hypothetical protein
VGERTGCPPSCLPVLFQRHIWSSGKKPTPEEFPIREERRNALDWTNSLQKAVMISHRNVIANIIQLRAFNTPARKLYNNEPQISLGLLPFSHIYGLVVVTHASVYVGDEVVVMPKFELQSFLASIQNFKIQHIYLVGGRQRYMSKPRTNNCGASRYLQSSFR